MICMLLLIDYQKPSLNSIYLIEASIKVSIFLLGIRPGVMRTILLVLNKFENIKIPQVLNISLTR